MKQNNISSLKLNEINIPIYYSTPYANFKSLLY